MKIKKPIGYFLIGFLVSYAQNINFIIFPTVCTDGTDFLSQDNFAHSHLMTCLNIFAGFLGLSIFLLCKHYLVLYPKIN